MFFSSHAPKFGLPPGQIDLWEISVDAQPYAIDINELKGFLNIPVEDTAFDAEKQGLLLAAQKAIEDYCHISIVEKTWIGYFPQFFSFLRINRRPFVAVTKIEYVAPDTGTITTVDPTTYIAIKAPQKTGQVIIGDGLSWPMTASRPDAVRITVKAGYCKTDIPEDMRLAIKITTAKLDHERGDDGGGGGGRNTVFAMKHPMGPQMIPDAAKVLLSPYRYKSIGVA